MELRENGTALISDRRSKTDPEAEEATLYIGPQACEALKAIGPAEELLDRNTPVYGFHPGK